VPPRRFHSPHSLPNLFHFGSVYGVFPSRPCSFRDAVRPLERRTPLTVSVGPRAVTSLRAQPTVLGFCTFTKVPPGGLLFRRTSLRLPPWDSSSLRFITLDGAVDQCNRSDPITRVYCASPHVLYRFGRKLTLPLAPQGFDHRKLMLFSLETNPPP
jgi:hypothetical protein